MSEQTEGLWEISVYQWHQQFTKGKLSTVLVNVRRFKGTEKVGAFLRVGGPKDSENVLSFAVLGWYVHMQKKCFSPS